MANARGIFCRAASAAGCAAILALGLMPVASAQSVISAHSGIIHYVEGDVTIDGNAIHPKFAEFPDVKAGQLVATAEGRAEILLTPGVFLRLAENSSVRMLSNVLADTRLELVSGSALVEVGELLEHNAISFEVSGIHMELAKKGLFRIDATPANMRVYEGQARVSSGSQSLTAHKGHQIDLEAAKLAETRFETKETDAFYRWSARRAEYVAAANVISARVASNSEYGSGYSSGASAWSWNPYFGMYTFLPRSGIYWSPFGSQFYSPGVITGIYIPQRGVSTNAGVPSSGGMGTVSVASPAGGGVNGGTGGLRGGAGGFSGGAAGAGRMSGGNRR